MKIPTLETERLWLRELRDADLDAYAAFVADPAVTRYLGDGAVLDRAQAWRQLAMFVGHWQLRGYGMWAVERKDTGDFVGRVGLHRPEGWPDLEVGWMLGRSAWGHGFATEAAHRAIQFAFEELGRPHVVSLILPENRASIAVAERLGETCVGEVEVGQARALLYRLERSG